jgi:hypothetical protein
MTTSGWRVSRDYEHEAININVYAYGKPYSRSHRRLPEFVPSRHRERAPYRNLASAAQTALELTRSRGELMVRNSNPHVFDML